jgi:hypothetical protein
MTKVQKIKTVATAKADNFLDSTATQLGQTDAAPTASEKPKDTTIYKIEEFLKAQYNFRYNTVKNQIEYKTIAGSSWSCCDEITTNGIECDIMREGPKNVKNTLHTLLTTSQKYDPITGYLESLPPWDGKDHIKKLASFVRMPPAQRTWFDVNFEKHLVRTLACATGRIPFNKQIFTLISGQNDGKTTFLRFLVPPAWRDLFTEDIDFDSKDGLVSVAQNVFIILDELSALRRSEINTVKSMVSKDTVKARLPYDKQPTNLKRRASFFASTNTDEFLTDETGNVRWLCFKILGVNHDDGGKNGYNRNIDINKVWAHAYHLLNAPDYRHQLTAAELIQSEETNQSHTKKGAEYEAILTNMKNDDSGVFMTASAIKKRLEEHPFNYKLAATEYVGRACVQLNWKKVSKRVDGKPLYGYMVLVLDEKSTSEGPILGQNTYYEKTPF